MVDEARNCGVAFREEMVKRLVLGKEPKNKPRGYVAPDPLGLLHDSMNFAWRILEYIPKRTKYKDWKHRKSFLGYYLPLCEPRTIPDGSEIDKSVEIRIAKMADYKPPNVN